MKKMILSIFILMSIFSVITYLVKGLDAAQEDITQHREIRLLLKNDIDGKNVIDGQKITDHEMGILIFEVAIEENRGPDGKPYRPSVKFEENKFKIMVNGKDIPHYVLGDYFDYNDKVAYCVRRVAVRLGHETGKRSIQVALDKLFTKVAINYQPVGQIAICGLFDGKALFGQEDVSIDWLGCYLERKTIKLTINGKEVDSEVRVSKYGAELLEGVVKEKLNIGANVIKIVAVDTKGEMQEKELIFFYYPKNEIPVGDIFVLRLGHSGSKSGPFYRAKVDGKGLIIIRNSFLLPQDFVITGLGKELGFTERDWPVLAGFEAVQRGEAVIKIEKKLYFKDTVWLEDKKLHVTVVDKESTDVNTENIRGKVIGELKKAKLTGTKSSYDLISEAYEKGEIDYDTCLLYKTYSVFEATSLPIKYRSQVPDICATLVIMEIQRNWEKLRPETKERISPYIQPIRKPPGELPKRNDSSKNQQGEGIK